MNTILWIIQSVLAVFFIFPGLGKVRNTKQKHIKDGHIKPGASMLPIRILGVLELLGCIGIIVPWLTGIATILTPITAICFCLIMLSGSIIHFIKNEYKMFPMLVVVFILSAAVAYYRWIQII